MRGPPSERCPAVMNKKIGLASSEKKTPAAGMAAGAF
jgi:hypothetical protein